MALGRGGIGIVGGLLVTGAVLATFAVGYVALAGHMTRFGGLYEFVAAGLGRSLGVGASFIALISYGVMTVRDSPSSSWTRFNVKPLPAATPMLTFWRGPWPRPARARPRVRPSARA